MDKGRDIEKTKITKRGMITLERVTIGGMRIL